MTGFRRASLCVAIATSLLAMSFVAEAREGFALAPVKLTPTVAEQKLIHSAGAGTVADFSSWDAKANDPKHGAQWGSERTIRAELIYALAIGTNPEWPVQPRGVQLKGARITGSLNLSAGVIAYPLTLTDCYFGNAVDLSDASANKIDFNDSVIVDNFFANHLNARYFFLEKTTVKGALELVDAHISGIVSCRGARLENGLDGERVTVGGSVFLDKGFSASGEVDLSNATIGADLWGDGGSFRNNGHISLDASVVKVGGSVELGEGFESDGEVRFLSAKVGRLRCHGVFNNSNGSLSVRLAGAKISGPFIWTLNKSPTGIVDFEEAEVEDLIDDEASWPKAGSLRLDGFTYQRLTEGAPTAASERLKWLRLQPAKTFLPQPYEQLAHVLREMGHESDALEIAIAEQEEERRYGELSPWGWFKSWILDYTVGYGYKPWRALYWIGLVLVSGAVVFARAHRAGLIQPSEVARQGEQRLFEPFVYSLDVFLPFIDLHQRSDWRLRPKGAPGWSYRFCELYFFLHILAGWALIAIAAAAMSGLVKGG